MARIWAEGFESSESNTVLLIGGIRDGEQLAWDALPPELHFPVLVDLSWILGKEENDIPNAPVQIVRYKRIADTCNYVCINWNKS